MRRTKALRLVLLGGGVTSLLAACGDDEARAAECARARAEMRPNAEQICQQSRSRSSTSSSWFSGRSVQQSTDLSSSKGSSARSGFGGSASSSGS